MCCCASFANFCAGCLGSGGYCSEFVGPAACNPELCGSCITGAVAAPVEVVTLGSDTGICGNPCITPCLIPNSAIPCCAINQKGVTCCVPDSPTQEGTTDQPPCAYCNPDACVEQKTQGSPRGGGSGAGTAPSAGGGRSGGGASSSQLSALSQAMNRFGSMIASLLSGGKKTSGAAIVAGTAIKPKTAISSNTMLLVLIVVGGLLLMIAFGHAPEGD